MKYEPVIGLEVHAQLSTATKLFCACSTSFGDAPNSHVCERCLGMPGVLPVLNHRAAELAVRAALALGCTINRRSQWSRKNYFYPDLPKGYQISQFDQPYATHGELRLPGADDGEARVIGITRIHMEEDAAKNVHDDHAANNRSYVDFNRGGTPLIEIVSAPDIRSSAEAASYMRALRQILRYLDVCDGNMERGNLRCDANVSLRPVGQAELGIRTELKNLNSFRFVQAAIDFEILRQTEVLDDGGAVVQETRLWDSEAKTTRTLRSKEEAHDYRYFPDPDLPDLVLAADEVAGIRAAMPELPAQALRRYVDDYGLSEYDAGILTDEAPLARFFDAAVAAHPNPKAIANWVINELLRELKGQPVEQSLDALPFGAAELAELVALIDDGTISGKIAKEVFADLMTAGGSPRSVVANKGLTQISDTSSIDPIIDAVIASNPDSVAIYRAGKTQVIGFFVGQVMKATGGKANPKIVNEMLRKKLDS